MSDDPCFRLYSGDGTTISHRNLRLPLFEKTERLTDPRYYLAEQPLRNAVNVALALGQPLLVTGEPGTGKTQLAASIAYELDLPPPLAFQTKTTSTATDLFYRYDNLRHFHDAQFGKDQLDVESYISYEALGLAILLSLEPRMSSAYLPQSLRDRGPTRSVVLIDEIDKAPRDLPNDILNELENMSFTVKEVGRTFAAEPRYRPIVVLTSNSEKNLPDPFLRRCVFYNISFPDRQRLAVILERRLSFAGAFTPEMVKNAIRHFERIRSLPLKKKPATAECLAWLQILEKMELDVGNLKAGQLEMLALSYSILVKSQEDLVLLQKTFLPSPETRDER